MNYKIVSGVKVPDIKLGRLFWYVSIAIMAIFDILFMMYDILSK